MAVEWLWNGCVLGLGSSFLSFLFLRPFSFGLSGGCTLAVSNGCVLVGACLGLAFIFVFVLCMLWFTRIGLFFAFVPPTFGSFRDLFFECYCLGLMAVSWSFLGHVLAVSWMCLCWGVWWLWLCLGCVLAFFPLVYLIMQLAESWLCLGCCFEP